MIKLIFLMTLAATSPAIAQPLSLHLVCRGIGDHMVAHGGAAYVRGSTGQYATAITSHESQEQFADQLDLDIDGATATARVPRRFLPRFHGGEGGLFDIKDLTVTDDAITGTVLINYANHPKLRVDRRTGSVAMDGKVGSFAGDCRPYDPAADKRAF